MSERRGNLGLGLLALVSIACCIGLPLVAAAGIGVAVATWIGGAVLGAIVLGGAALVFGLRLRRRHGGSLPLMRSRP
jgi:asparagine N-glycosylation enzyme membrane subunit Stt3